MACGSCAQRKAAPKYEYKDKSGKVTVFSTESEARAAVARRGGSYTPTK